MATRRCTGHTRALLKAQEGTRQTGPGSPAASCHCPGQTESGGPLPLELSILHPAPGHSAPAPKLLFQPQGLGNRCFPHLRYPGSPYLAPPPPSGVACPHRPAHHPTPSAPSTSYLTTLTVRSETCLITVSPKTASSQENKGFIFPALTTKGRALTKVFGKYL